MFFRNITRSCCLTAENSPWPSHLCQNKSHCLYNGNQTQQDLSSTIMAHAHSALTHWVHYLFTAVGLRLWVSFYLPAMFSLWPSPWITPLLLGFLVNYPACSDSWKKRNNFCHLSQKVSTPFGSKAFITTCIMDNYSLSLSSSVSSF